jgi:hypothetical protein
MTIEKECESHARGSVDIGYRVIATTRSTNPDWSGYDLCDECAEYYDSEPPLPIATEDEETQ